MHLEFRITDEDFSNLEKFIGATVSEVYFQREFKENPSVSAYMAAFKIPGSKFLRIITDDWSDTNKEAINCYQLRAQLVTDPAYAFNGTTNEPIPIESMAVPSIKITQIDIYEFNYVVDDESVAYDTALLFSENTENKIFIGINNSSIAGDVYFLLEKNKISETLGQYIHAKTIKNA